MIDAAAAAVVVEHVSVRGMRTWGRLDLELQPGIVVFLGPNGVGKTNLLEAIAFAVSGASPRTHTELKVVAHDAPFARMSARTRIDGAIGSRTAIIDRVHGKRLELDDAPVRSRAEYAAAAPSATFLPERLLVLRGAPARRRALLDRLVERLEPTAARIGTDYARAVQHRNVLLRRARTSGRVDEDALAPWDTQVAQLGSQLRSLRSGVAERLRAPFADRFEQLTGLPEASIRIELRGADIAASLIEQRDVDVRRGSTSTGPHHDEIITEQQGRDLRTWGSTGEQRAALLAWTLAEADLVRDTLGVRPALLLDEPWAELDAARRTLLTRTLASYGQVFVTSTEPPQHLTSLAPDAQLLRVSSGVIEPWATTTSFPDPAMPPPA